MPVDSGDSGPSAAEACAAQTPPAAATQTEAPPLCRVPLIVDTDGGWDDLAAVALLAEHGVPPGLVTVGHGMCPPGHAAPLLRRLLATLGHPDIPVAIGAEVAPSGVDIVGEAEWGGDYRGGLLKAGDVLGLADLPFPHVTPNPPRCRDNIGGATDVTHMNGATAFQDASVAKGCPHSSPPVPPANDRASSVGDDSRCTNNDAAAAILSAAGENEVNGGVAILTLGACTNVGAAATASPAAFQAGVRRVIVQCRLFDGDGGGQPYNVRFDPQSLRVILQSGVPVSLVCGPQCYSAAAAACSPTVAAAMATVGTPGGRVLAALARVHPESLQFDPVAAAFLLRPAAFASPSPVAATVGDDGRLTLTPADEGGLVEAVETIDIEQYTALFTRPQQLPTFVGDGLYRADGGALLERLWHLADHAEVLGDPAEPIAADTGPPWLPLRRCDGRYSLGRRWAKHLGAVHPSALVHAAIAGANVPDITRHAAVIGVDSADANRREPTEVELRVGEQGSTEGDPVVVIRLQGGGGLLSYRKADGRFVHTFNTESGLCRKVLAVGGAHGVHAVAEAAGERGGTLFRVCCAVLWWIDDRHGERTRLAPIIVVAIRRGLARAACRVVHSADAGASRGE